MLKILLLYVDLHARLFGTCLLLEGQLVTCHRFILFLSVLPCASLLSVGVSLVLFVR